jgi:hypothetical protein
MARLRRPHAVPDDGQRLAQGRCPCVWLGQEEREAFDLQERWRLVEERSRDAVVRYADAGGLTLEQAEEQLAGLPAPKIRDRAQALAYAEQHRGHEPCATERRELVRLRKQALASGGRS